MMVWAASRNRCTLCSARSFAALVERSTARCFQAGSSLGVLMSGSIFCIICRTLLYGSGRLPTAPAVSLPGILGLSFSFSSMLFREYSHLPGQFSRAAEQAIQDQGAPDVAAQAAPPARPRPVPGPSRLLRPGVIGSARR